MFSTRLKCILPTVLILTASASASSPWFTGPLLAPAGITIPAGHSNFEFYQFNTRVEGTFNRHWKLSHSPEGASKVFNPIYSVGLSDDVDVQASVPYTVNKSQNYKSHHIGDTSVNMGYQALLQNNALWKPNLRIVLQEIIPTGRYDRLNPYSYGTDATGLGSYQTSLFFNFQHLLTLDPDHFFRSRLSLSYTRPASVRLTGYTSYGGSEDTFGRVNPGDYFNADWAGEFTFTQNWVGVMEAFVSRRAETHFRGNRGTKSDSSQANIGHQQIDQISIAPAVEYNFSGNYGLIAGVWHTLAGRDTSDFTAVVVAFNAYW